MHTRVIPSPACSYFHRLFHVHSSSEAVRPGWIIESRSSVSPSSPLEKSSSDTTTFRAIWRDKRFFFTTYRLLIISNFDTADMSYFIISDRPWPSLFFFFFPSGQRHGRPFDSRPGLVGPLCDSRTAELLFRNICITKCFIARRAGAREREKNEAGQRAHAHHGLAVCSASRRDELDRLHSTRSQRRMKNASGVYRHRDGPKLTSRLCAGTL